MPVFNRYKSNVSLCSHGVRGIKKKKNIWYFLIISHNGFVQDTGVWIIELLMSQRNFSQTTCVQQNDIINKLSVYYVFF